MNRRAHSLYNADLPPSAIAALDAGGPAAAWAIDVGTGRILAANSSGRVALGLPDGDGAPPVLDAATPGLSLLREMAEAGDETQVAVLTFWARARAQKFKAQIHITHAGAQTLAVVVAAMPETDGMLRTQGSIVLPGDDGATLKEIARRIREGASARETSKRGGRVANPPNAVPPPSVPAAGPHLATLAHELKTPLAAISAASEIMKDERFGPLGNARYAGYAADIHESALHILRIADRLLDRGASAGPVAALDFVQLDMRNILEALASQLSPLAHDKGIKLGLDVTRHLPHVIADATSVRQIVLNLFANALRHTGSGGRITISAQIQDDGTLKVAMSDSGEGMTRAEANRILRAAASAQTHSSADASFHHFPVATAGHGIGIPLVISLAKANGAEFTFDSAPGGGTSASIVFGRDRIVPV
jgi:two-component system, cell cycle sensor histidine kinase PleC